MYDKDYAPNLDPRWVYAVAGGEHHMKDCALATGGSTNTRVQVNEL